MPTAAIFVDVQNIYYTCREAFARQFNYRMLYQQLADEYNISHAFAYAIDSQNEGQKKFQSALRHMGFEVKLKPYIQRSDGSSKGDWDVGITLDVIDYAKDVEHIFLMSGDGDFDLLLQRVSQRYDVVTHVIGVEPLTATSLVQQCDFFHPVTLEQLI
ncbi:MAG: NYN domain-containing protein [Pseudomonadota bacterium]